MEDELSDSSLPETGFIFISYLFDSLADYRIQVWNISCLEP